MDHEDWRWIFDGHHPAQWNMDADASLLDDCGQGRIPPTVRVYGWSQPAVTIGYSQNADAEVDLERCRELDIPVVRRPTGGRALLHHREVTYAVVAPVSLSPFHRGLKATFGAISEALLAGLHELGIAGGINAGKPQSGQSRSPACFASLNHCEITVNSQKLVGSAQKRTSQAFLQHGSLIIESDHALFTSLLKFDNENDRKRTWQRLTDSTTALNQVSDRKFSFEEINAALRDGFRKTLSGACLNL